MQPVVYLLHFRAPIGNLASSRGQAQHYVGWTPDLDRRLAVHRAGRGAALTRAAVERGIEWDVFVLGAGDWTLEKRVKALKNNVRLCPICGTRHPGGKLHAPVQSIHQLALDLDVDPFASVPLRFQHTPMDRWEFLRRRSMRTLVPVLAIGDTSDCDIPY